MSSVLLYALLFYSKIIYVQKSSKILCHPLSSPSEYIVLENLLLGTEEGQATNVIDPKCNCILRNSVCGFVDAFFCACGVPSLMLAMFEIVTSLHKNV